MAKSIKCIKLAVLTTNKNNDGVVYIDLNVIEENVFNENI